jgi:hypothetical protein
VNTHWTDRLSEYADGDLSPAERAHCDAHLAVCASCQGVLREIQMVAAEVTADPETWPAADLWPGILARIETSTNVVPFGAPKAAPATRRQFVFTLPQLALAASLLIAVSAGVAYLALDRVAGVPGATQEDPIQAQAEPMMPPSADVTKANFADAQFDQAVSDLEQILADQRDVLDPRTVLIIERNLTVIDEAIRQARAALDADPANPFLNSHLADARRKKLDLLRHAAAIAQPSGD